MGFDKLSGGQDRYSNPSSVRLRITQSSLFVVAALAAWRVAKATTTNGELISGKTLNIATLLLFTPQIQEDNTKENGGTDNQSHDGHEK